MFSLNDSMRYLLYNQPTDMRKSYHSLSGIVANILDCDPCSGDVYLFINKNRNRIKLLHWEPRGMVIYSKLLVADTLGRGPDIGGDGLSDIIEWRDLVLLIEDIFDETRQSQATS